MGTAETLLVIGAVAVGGWYVINYVLPNLPGGNPFDNTGGEFVEGEVGASTSAGTSTPGPFPDNTCKMGNNGGTCWRAKACSTSKPYNGVSYRNKSVSWCAKGPCDTARAQWNQLFGCVNSTPKPATPPKVTNCPGKSGNCTWDCKNAYCWTSTACGKYAKSCTSQGQSSNRTTGCNVARNRFIGAYGSCVSSSTPYTQATAGPCKGLTGQTACTCAASHGACQSNYHGVFSNGKCLCIKNAAPAPAPGGFAACNGLAGATLCACKGTHGGCKAGFKGVLHGAGPGCDCVKA